VWVCASAHGCVGVWVCGCVDVWVCGCVGVGVWVCVWCSMDAVSQLARSIPSLSFNPTVRSLAVRLLGRILGKNLGLLLGTVAGTNPKGNPSTRDEIVFSASLLASLSLDDETVDMLMEHRCALRAGGYTWNLIFAWGLCAPLFGVMHRLCLPAAGMRVGTP
jgi:hypothetical protein